MRQKRKVWKEAPAPEAVWVNERHLYVMPNDLESFLAALAAIQDYYAQLWKRHANVQVNVIMNDAFGFLLPAFKMGDNVLDVIWLKERALGSIVHLDMDHVVDFDVDRARFLAKKSEKSLVQTFGIMLGSDPQRSLPVLNALPLPETPQFDVIILPFLDAEKFYSFLQNNHPELTVHYAKTEFREHKLAHSAKMMVGVKSGMTYLAAAFGTGVVEIYPPSSEPRHWLSKWSHPMYQMIYVEPEQANAELVYRAWVNLWRRVQSFHRIVQESSTMTAPSTSIAESAGTSSAKPATEDSPPPSALLVKDT